MNAPLCHIASFVVLHAPEAAPALDAHVACLPGFEIAVRAGSRSVLLCESEDERALLDRVEALRAVPGVIAITLVHHHLEAAERLAKEIDHADPS